MENNYIKCNNLVSHDDFGNKVFCERFDLFKGDLVAIVGNNGKDIGLMLKLLSGMLPIESGDLSIMDTDFNRASYSYIQKTRARTGFVFESASLISNLTLFDNIALPLRYHFKTFKKEYLNNRVQKIMQKFEIIEYINERPANVTFEVRKKCLYCRALIMRPAVLFYHEPFIGLGMKTRSFVKQLMIDLHIRNQIPAIMAVSDIDMVYNFVSRFIVMDQGKIYKVINDNTELKTLCVEDPLIRTLIGEILYVA